MTSRPWSEIREEPLARFRTVWWMRRLDVSPEAELESGRDLLDERCRLRIVAQVHLTVIAA
jgi:hypothetical protein